MTPEQIADAIKEAWSEGFCTGPDAGLDMEECWAESDAKKAYDRVLQLKI